MLRSRILGRAGYGLCSRVPRLPPLSITSAARHGQWRSLRGVHTGGPFQPMRPPSPQELGQPRAAKQYPRGRKWTRRLLLTTAVLGGIYLVDTQVGGAGLTRTARTFGTTLLVALDYNINFRPEPWFGGSVADLHHRSAERMATLLRENGGLYLKMGQAIAMQSAMLPPAFQKMFARMFDDAPQDDWRDVEAVIRADFGKSVEEVFGVSFTGKPGFGVMEKTARASASVAQVHWARLPDGREVAIKVQKRDIAKQISWDLWAFKTVTWIYSNWFDIPFYSLVPYVAERLELETDFINEAKNSETMRELINNEKSMRGRVYVPITYPELTSRRVMTAEWIEGVQLWDKKAITGRWLGGRGKGTPGARVPLPEVDMDAARLAMRTQPHADRLKPERQEWRGRRGSGGLGLSTKEVMSTVTDLFAAQIFQWGVVHCDPHPGNVFVRRLPSGRAEVVLIDHGLYVYMTPTFRRQYAEFWKALMTFDNETIARVTSAWGIRGADFFASATLMRPYEGGSGSTRDAIDGASRMSPAERHHAMEQRMKQGLRDMLADEDRWPKELLFISRNMRIVQSNNQYMGSPVNRIKVMGTWASGSLFRDPALGWRARARYAWRHALFTAVMAASDVAFYVLKVRQWLGLGGGMEDVMEQRMKDMAQDMGIELQHEVFSG
ncbi:ABC1 domain protein [Cordyceps fumosorosea ARSEF 2679]|uniref:ABC1 domain protein n=1 Tax=Cordyceps fumosorosea (strain ARSEF 2679) TaxID=1081104 RepID=A0A168D6M2_CORFA|nr:ABC1 domain protein [Cordyceps fumosorosea ARSEF 2679]OAA72231.1 ABC1 domain protein [Cordyceps fumosorosea ARSEF 2679]